jgi:DNA-3-methyladenine glycosylase I
VSDPGVVVGDDGLARPGWASVDPMLREYYDTEWGMPVRDERGLFERLSLEAFQSGLSWATILRKRPAFRAAFDGFEPEKVAGYGDGEIGRLLSDAGIVRHRGKITATIDNARAVVAMADAGTSLTQVAWAHAPAPRGAPLVGRDEIPALTPESTALSRALKGWGMRFVGPTTVYAFMQSAGLVDDHLAGCHRAGTAADQRGQRARPPDAPARS